MRAGFLYDRIYWCVVLLFSFQMAACASSDIPEVSMPEVIAPSIPATTPERVVLPSIPLPVPDSPALSDVLPVSAGVVSRVSVKPVVIIPQSAWMKRQLYIDTSRLMPHSLAIQRITIHHTATPQGKNARLSLRGIQRYHIMEKGWADIAYHYLIAADGKIYEGRNAAYVGSSSTDYKLDNNVMIALIGNFEKYPPSVAAMSSLKSLVVDKLINYKLKPEVVYTHGEQTDTLCPGRYLKDWYNNEGREAIVKQFAIRLISP